MSFNECCNRSHSYSHHHSSICTVKLLLFEGRCDGISGRYNDAILSKDETCFRAAEIGGDGIRLVGRRGRGGANLVFTGDGFWAGTVPGGPKGGSGGLLSLYLTRHILSILHLDCRISTSLQCTFLLVFLNNRLISSMILYWFPLLDFRFFLNLLLEFS